MPIEVTLVDGSTRLLEQAHGESEQTLTEAIRFHRFDWVRSSSPGEWINARHIVSFREVAARVDVSSPST